MLFHGLLWVPLVPSTMHLVHSSYSVFWLSKKHKKCKQFALSNNSLALPLNQGKIYTSKTSFSAVNKAYLSQFQEDFSVFLKCRSSELVPDGCMVLIIHERESADPTCKDSCYTWEVLAEAISYMVSQVKPHHLFFHSMVNFVLIVGPQGILDEETLDFFSVPYYTPFQEEVQSLADTNAIEIGDQNVWSDPESRAKGIRAYTDPMASKQFGGGVMKNVHDKVSEILVEDFKQGKNQPRVLVLLLC
ncbi:hypothetical protein CRYUN_Cryun09bG0107500 [Craigia yunnanensis]